MFECRPRPLCAALAAAAIALGLTPAVASAASSTLGPGQTLTAGQSLTSPDGHYSLIMQSDGNLVLYVAGGRVLWSTKTKGDTGDHLLMQTNGNLVLYAADGNALWSTNTSGAGCSRLVMQGDGNLVLYGPSKAVWATSTVNSTLQPGEKLTAGQELFAAGEKFHLIMQGDGNLVLYNSVGKWLWATKTEGTGAQFAVMQGDGNLVVYTGAGKAVWASNTAGKSGAHLVVQSDGNVVLYAGSTAIWSSGTAGAVPGFRKAPAPAATAAATGNCGVPVPTPPPTPAPTPPPPVVVYVPVVVHVPAPRARHHVKVRLVMSWTWNGPRTRLFGVAANRVPRHAGIVVICHGRGCPAHAHLASARVKHLLRSLAGQSYRAGDRVFITIRVPHEVSERIEVVIRSGRKPEAKLL